MYGFWRCESGRVDDRTPVIAQCFRCHRIRRYKRFAMRSLQSVLADEAAGHLKARAILFAVLMTKPGDHRRYVLRLKLLEQIRR